MHALCVLSKLNTKNYNGNKICEVDLFFLTLVYELNEISQLKFIRLN